VTLAAGHLGARDPSSAGARANGGMVERFVPSAAVGLRRATQWADVGHGITHILPASLDVCGRRETMGANLAAPQPSAGAGRQGMEMIENAHRDSAGAAPP
jgi:hypothetical protein